MKKDSIVYKFPVFVALCLGVLIFCSLVISLLEKRLFDYKLKIKRFDKSDTIVNMKSWKLPLKADIKNETFEYIDIEYKNCLIKNVKSIEIE